MTFSKYQKAIFTFVKKAVGNANVEAVAGSGKTFTIVEAAKYVPVTAQSVFLAFNKNIADELQKKLPPYVKAMTTHSLCFRAINSSGSRMKVDSEKLTRLMDGLLSLPEKQQLRGQIRKLVSIAKANGLVPNAAAGMAKGLVPDVPEFWAEVISNYSLEFENNWQEETAVSRAKELLRFSIENRDNQIDFDDMLYLPVVLGMSFPKFDWIFCDESQDLNAIQHEILQRIAKPTSHTIAVGDPFQAIYRFRGAASDSMAKLAEINGAKTLPLSICYRCSKAVVNEAKMIVPHIEAAEDAEEGMIYHGLPEQDKLAAFTPDAAVLCPFNAPLIEAAYMFIRSKVACRILGREIGEGLIKLVRKLERNGAGNVKQLETALEAYYHDELERLAGKESRQNALTDKVETLGVFLSELAPGEPVDRLVREIQTLFVDSNAGMLTLSTVHKAKGLEYPKVFFLESDLLKMTTRKGKPIHPEEIKQKRNLLYVGITRSKLDLYYITGADLKRLGEKGQPNGTQPSNPV
jgi:DNA helicase-2/ATP-dependent DNA helicase PcrA